MPSFIRTTSSGNLPDARVPRTPLRAIFVSIIIGVSCGGIMFVFNLPGALSEGLAKEYGISSGDVAYLMMAYTIPSTITAMIAAQALAFVGLNSVSFMCSAIVQLGSLCFALAPVIEPSSPMGLMLIAQVINGSGDPLGLACSPAMVSRWWRHNHSGLAMGTTLMISQLFGCMMPFVLLPRVHASMGLHAALWVGSVAQFIALIFLILYFWLERWYRPYLAVIDAVDSREGESSSKAAFGGSVSCCNRLKAIPSNAWLQIIAVCLIPVTQYVSLALLPGYLSGTHHMSEVEAGNCTSLISWCCVTAPLWGMLADSPSVGRLHVQLVGVSAAILCFIFLGSGFSDWPVLVAMGLSFALLDQNSYVCVEALVPDPHLIDFAYGVMGGFFNIGLGTMSFVAGRVSTHQMPIVYSISLTAGLVVTLILLLRVRKSDDAIQKGLLPQRRLGGLVSANGGGLSPSTPARLIEVQ